MKITTCRAIGQQLARAGAACVLAVGAGALTAASAAQATARPDCPAAIVSGASATVTCSYTGAARYWTVPAGVTQATFTLYGAAGGTGGDTGPGGSGAEVTGTLPVTPGTVLQVNVGQAAANSAAAFGGGRGGGGASDIRDGTYTLADRLLVAGGGGSGGAGGGGVSVSFAAGGAGGNADSPGASGASTPGTCGGTLGGGGGGSAGTAAMGGAGGTVTSSGDECLGGTSTLDGTAGSEGSGGAGGSGGAAGGGGGGGYYGGGGGAGGGYDGEGGGGGGGGGGGSSYTGTATGASVNDDPASPPPGGNGEVVITYHPVLTVTDHSLSGHETAVSCLTASRCVAVGSQGRHGTVVTLTGGAQSHIAVLDGASVIDSVTCPSASGCWAIGRPYRGAGAYLVKISSGGRPEAERTVTLPAGTTLGPIWCVRMNDCEVAGNNNHAHPAAIEVGTWNGAKLRLYRVPVSDGTRVSMTGISCWFGACAAVGSAVVGGAGTDLIVTTFNGTPRSLNADSGYALSSISCVTLTSAAGGTCFAAGAAVVVRVTDGVAADPQTVPGWNGTAIECVGHDCEAAGGEVYGLAYADVLVSRSNGISGSPVIVQTGPGYAGIAARGTSGFIAIGASSGSGSEDTVG